MFFIDSENVNEISDAALNGFIIEMCRATF